MLVTRPAPASLDARMASGGAGFGSGNSADQLEDLLTSTGWTLSFASSGAGLGLAIVKSYVEGHEVVGWKRSVRSTFGGAARRASAAAGGDQPPLADGAGSPSTLRGCRPAPGQRRAGCRPVPADRRLRARLGRGGTRTGGSRRRRCAAAPEPAAAVPDRGRPGGGRALPPLHLDPGRRGAQGPGGQPLRPGSDGCSPVGLPGGAGAPSRVRACRGPPAGARAGELARRRDGAPGRQRRPSARPLSHPHRRRTLPAGRCYAPVPVSATRSGCPGTLGDARDCCSSSTAPGRRAEG